VMLPFFVRFQGFFSGVISGIVLVARVENFCLWPLKL